MYIEEELDKLLFISITNSFLYIYRIISKKKIKVKKGIELILSLKF